METTPPNQNLSEQGNIVESKEAKLRKTILGMRTMIRNHRDQRGDDRCFLDDYLVWKLLKDSPPEPTKFTTEEGMNQCTIFFNNRRADKPDVIPEDAILNPERWNDDISEVNFGKLSKHLLKIEEAIRKHRDTAKERPLTVEDDRALYAVLPEKIPADFRLPPKDEFLGRAKSCAGCPAFWDSHAQCGHKPEHNFHQWGKDCK